MERARNEKKSGKKMQIENVGWRFGLAVSLSLIAKKKCLQTNTKNQEFGLLVGFTWRCWGDVAAAVLRWNVYGESRRFWSSGWFDSKDLDLEFGYW